MGILQDVDAHEDAATLTDPRTGKVRITTSAADQHAVSAAVAAARTAAPRWARRTPGERSRSLLRLADAVEARAQQYEQAEQAGTGKPAAEAAGEIGQCVDLLRFYAGAARAETTPASGQLLPGRESWVRWEPMGVVAAIVPWNYPLLMAVWRLAPALAAGNAVVLKPAETTPDTALLLAEDAAETLGPGVLTTLPGDRHTGRLLVSSEVDAIAFTGSHRAGLDVAARAGLRRVSLELGGNCAAIVLPDAPSYTYEQLVVAVTYNAGQSCAAPARVITLRENHDEVVANLAAAMEARRAGVDFGPLNNSDQLARHDKIIGESRAAVRHEAGVCPGDGEESGYWRPGLVLADLPADDSAVLSEVFGPVLTVQSAAGPDDLVRMANSVPQGLAASVWSESVSRTLALAKAIDVGEVWVNCHLEQTAELTHGGWHGTDLSVLAMAEYRRPKTVTVRIDEP